MGSYTNDILIRKHNAPYLFDDIESMFKSNNLTTPEIIWSPSKFKLSIGKTYRNGFFYNRLEIGEEMWKLLGHSSFNEKLNPMTRAVVAHEIAHVINRDTSLLSLSNLGMISPLLGIISGLIAQNYIISRAKIDNTSQFDEHLIEKCQKDKIKDVNYLGSYLASAGLGLIGGLLIRRSIFRYKEFSADRVAANMEGKENLISALELFESRNKSILESFKKEGLSKPEVNAINFISESIRELFFHPSISERISRIQKI